MAPHHTDDPLRIHGLYRAIRAVIGLLLKVLARVDVEGLGNIPKRGPYLLVTNHLHWLDSPLMMTILPHRANVFAADKWAGHWLIGPLMKSVNAIFVNRGEVDRKALRAALAILSAGGMLGMAPEGTRSKTGGLQHGRSGAAYLAYHARAPLLPVVCSGQERVVSSLFRLRRARVRVVIGRPFDPPAIQTKVTMAQLDAFTQDIMYRLAAMLPPEYRGEYADVAAKRPDLDIAPTTGGQ